MNILFYMHQFPGFGGMESVAATLATELANRGHSVSFLSHREGVGTSKITKLPAGIICRKMPDSKHLVSPTNVDFVKRLVAEHFIDIIMFLDSYAEIEENILGHDIRAKVITSEHSSPFYCTTEEHPERFNLSCRIKHALRHRRIHLPYYYEGKRKRFLYDNSDRYVLLSNRFYGEFKSMARLLDSRKLRAIPNPISPYLVPKVIDWGIKEKLMIFVGTLAEAKGGVQSLIALNILKQRNLIPEGWKFLMIGDGPERETCERYILSHRLGFAHLMGYSENPLPYYMRAKILLFPSAREGFGMTLVEAMSNGCVPIAFASYSSVFDIIAQGENGVLVDAFDIEKYAKAIHSLLVDESALDYMAHEAVKVSDRFALCKIADLWESLMEEVMHNA